MKEAYESLNKLSRLLKTIRLMRKEENKYFCIIYALVHPSFRNTAYVTNKSVFDPLLTN